MEASMGLRLSRLTLHGFKSFADKTVFTFDDLVTGIVGPNGCGKSNVVDAIKWVLGERSSKSLRGTEMIDVIFAGSSGRKPLGMASVALTFENPLMDAAELAQLSVKPMLVADVPAEVELLEARDESAESASEATADAAAGDTTTVAATEAAAVFPTEATAATPTAAEPAPAPARRRPLGVDADVVEIERRLYRDGESAYLINGRGARLKDIRELFMDTGVGADAYSIIEQGKVDAMLMASPQERRNIFEEAAGVAKYKQRRIEAQRKLERTQVNLKGTREQLESTERRLKLVRGQAAKARRFVELDVELKAWRSALAFEVYDDLRGRLEGLTSRQQDLGTQRESGAVALGEIEHEKQEAELRRQELGARQRELEQERLQSVHAQQQAQQRQGMLERAVEESVRQAAADRARLGEIEQRRMHGEAGIEDARESIAAFSEQLAEAERNLQSAGASRAGVLEVLSERRQQYSTRQAAAQRIERERAGLVASIQGEVRRCEGLREQLERLAVKRGRLGEDQKNLTSLGEQAKTTLSQSQSNAAGLEVALAELEARVGTMGTDRRDRAQKVAEQERELARLDSRLSTLRELVETRAGFAEGVRQVLEAKRKGGFAGVLAPLADLIRTADGIEGDVAAAIEAALASDLQALVVDSLDRVPSADELASLAGRVSFLAMSLPAADPTLQPTAMHAGTELATSNPASRVVALRSLVLSRETPGATDSGALNGLLDRLLGQTFLVTDLDAAMLLAAGPMRGARFVTRRGAVMDACGRIHAGPTGAEDSAGGLLRRRSEMEKLGAEVARISEAVAHEREELNRLDAEAAALSTQASQTRAALSQAQRTALQDQNKLERAQADLARLDREAKGVEQEATQLRERLAKLDEDRKGLEERAASLGRLHEEESAAAGALEGDLRSIQMRADAAMEQMTQAKVEVSRLTEQATNARRDLSRMEMARDEAIRSLRDLSVQVERQEARLVEHRAGIEQAIAQGATSRERAEKLATSLAELATSLADADRTCSELGGRLHSARQTVTTLERDWHALEVSRRELEVKRENLEERTLQEVAIDLTLEYTDYREMIQSGGVTRIDTSEAALRIDALRDQVKKLGHVNMDAMTEEQTLEAQNEGLVKAVADLDNARVQLTELIETLNCVSKERFTEVFTLIQQNFGSERGMFRKLFGGGKAEVRLMPLIKEVEQPDGSIAKVETNEIDVLESGIEVIAKPPGKEPRSISQLSGGEKTLTAVALLMSIFRSKPSCFCVLDEVDAALDEGNVARFNQTIREYTDKSRFIVITHNKRTMQFADRLYGVTMQERGVSTRVSVKFDQVDKDGKILPATVSAEIQAAPLIEVTPRGRGSRKRRAELAASSAVESTTESVADPAQTAGLN
jgi:chromosome segregation protein